MPEHLRALIYILILAAIFFAFAKKSISTIIEAKDFTRRQNLWLTLTLVAFLAHSFWIYTFIAAVLLIYTNRHETNPPALFFFILFILPGGTTQIPGMGLINYFFDLSHARVLELFILLPVFFTLIRHPPPSSFGRAGPDKILVTYIFFIALLHLRENNVTNTFRQALYLFLDIFLPYFVISRSLKNLQALRDAILCLVLAIMVVALLAVFESYKHWLLYFSLLDVLGLSMSVGHIGREGMLRVMVTAGQPIALGFLMTVGIGLYLYFQHFLQGKLLRRFGMLLIIAGLLASISRGPWVGAAILFLVFVATGHKPVPRLLTLVLASALVLFLLATLPGGEKVINLLPYIGTTDKATIDYREQLFANSMIVIQRNLWLGSVDFIESPEMQVLLTQGIVDIVNAYIGIALRFGLVGLGLFVCFFALTLFGIYRAMRSIPNRDSEEYLLGRALLATIIAIMVIIATVSSITIIPIVYWSVAGLGVAYANMILRNDAEAAR